MESKRVKFTGEVVISYDTDSPEFKEAFKTYKEAIYEKGTETDMLAHVVNSVVQRGIESNVNGVGNVARKGTHPSFVPEDFCGIYISDGYDDIEFEFDR
jgi:hypothetical protein